ncbi:lysylphosphatidylglycerol synthase transmembrane domain-containing protein [Senegalimassilia anaerobia]|uniref:lysylphosphatidylglycerol synthase transmembrane domain-containing protein n=1 Tax=Senegalimassilia anaerobia TaxID=1473216 RepID=UPI0026EED0AE|nr:lysylphosphatidylglycerol synthase transmembrane domain-containing protein [Senegalimassilia anaerobia]
MKFNVKNLFMGVVLIIVLAVVFLRGDQLVELGETMKQGSPLPLVAAILTQLGKYFAQSFAYSRSFAAVGERMEPKSTLPLVFGTFFMNTIAPSMNLAGTTLVVDDARRRGIPAGKATGAALLMQITIDGAFSTLMVCAFIFLAVTVGLSPVWFLMGMVVLCLVGTMVALLILAHKKPDLLMRLLRPVERVSRKVVARVRKKPLEPWAERIAQAFSEAAGMIGHSPKPTLQAYGCSLIASLCELSCFALVGIGFGVDTAPALVCGYVVATLFAMISVTPQGVGVVEAAVVVAFTSFGESAAAGTAIGLVYRGIVFWMPFIIGAVLINTTKAFKGDVKQAAYDQDMGAVAGTAATAARLEEEARADAARFKRAAALRSRMADAHAAHGGQPVAGTVPPEADAIAAGGAAMANAAAQTVPFAQGDTPALVAGTVPFVEGETPVPSADTAPFAEGIAVSPAAQTVPFAEAGAPAEAERTEPSVRIADTQVQPTVPFEPATTAKAPHAADTPDDLPGEEGSS